MSAVAKVWAKRLIAGTQQFENCPLRYKDDVRTILIESVKQGIITEERYEEITGEPYPVDEEEEGE